jgi:hypothetical protein
MDHMGFLAKLGSSVRNLFRSKPRDPRAEQEDRTRNPPPPGGKSRKRGTSVSQDTPQTDWRDTLNADDFRRTGHGGLGWDLRTVDLADWYDVVSSNVERIRYGADDLALQVVFKDGSLYQYEDVEPEVFMAFQRAPSPGSFVWYVLRQYGYQYAKIGGGESTTKPAAPRFDGQVYAVPEDIQKIQKKAGRKPTDGGLWNTGTPVARGAQPPPLPWY